MKKDCDHAKKIDLEIFSGYTSFSPPVYEKVVYGMPSACVCVNG
jgi:hypothetical protein